MIKLISPLIFWCITGELKQSKKPNISKRETENLQHLQNNSCQT